MAEKIKKGDFVEIEYEGFLKEGDILFDTTNEEQAKENHIHGQNSNYGPIVICVGESQLLGAIDNSVEGMNIGDSKKVNVEAEHAFGKKDSKMLKIVPINIFKKENIQPMPGLQVTVDGMFGVVKTVSGGRVIIDFNHPLAGKDVYYKIKTNRIISDEKEQVVSYIAMTLNMPREMIGIKMEGKNADIALPAKLPGELEKKLEEKIKKVIKIDKVMFKDSSKAKAVKKEGSEEAGADKHGRTPEDPHYGHDHE